MRGRDRSHIVRSRPELVEFGLFFVEAGPELFEVVQLSKIGRIRPELVETGPALLELDPTLADIVEN